MDLVLKFVEMESKLIMLVMMVMRTMEMGVLHSAKFKLALSVHKIFWPLTKDHFVLIQAL